MNDSVRHPLKRIELISGAKTKRLRLRSHRIALEGIQHEDELYLQWDAGNYRRLKTRNV